MDDQRVSWRLGRYLKEHRGTLAFLCIIALGIVYLSREPENLERLRAIGLEDFLLLSGFIICSYLFNAYRLKLLLTSFNINTRLKEWFSLFMINTLGNILFYKGGTASIAWLLKKRHSFSYSYFVTLWVASILITLLMISLAGQVSLLTIWLSFHQFHQWLFLFFASVSTILLLLGFILPSRLLLVRISRAKGIQQLVSAWEALRQNKRTLLLIASLDLVCLLLFSLRLFLCYIFIDSYLSFYYTNLMAIFISISALFSLTPSDIGIREFIVAMTSKVLGAGFRIGFLAAALDRTVSLFWTFLFGSLASRSLFKADRGSR